jgi:hypothetical protein
MKKKPQIFTRVDRKNTPVDLETLNALENEAMAEMRRRSLVDLLFEKKERIIREYGPVGAEEYNTAAGADKRAAHRIARQKSTETSMSNMSRLQKKRFIQVASDAVADAIGLDDFEPGEEATLQAKILQAVDEWLDERRQSK